MPQFTRLDRAYVPEGPYRVWSKGPKAYSNTDRFKITNPGSNRQAQFERELIILSQMEATATLPVFISWSNLPQMRMDWGCIGHAVASGFLQPLRDCDAGYVSHVTLAGAL